ncbi:hypothetical protein CkaCkLH20_04091 [Colletotrichum karsti]|uniref:Uncharacterized protein n=1 Tax=Colletotrichum karsti TaxID=1095194 RepID=A0A9P6I9A4_9PEZI|nr:uncharacterized protein CkaCkLH20_04091 [Colletotrichum karsti]KAF9878599.1 hypothetical protein CkaCkLH20_04091 [Colletotrichum karsti]
MATQCSEYPATANAPTAAAAANTEESRLLNLPYEIRLQIYGWVHAMHPIQHAQLAPWYPTPTYSAYHLKLIKPGEGTEGPAVRGKGTADADDTRDRKDATITANGTDDNEEPLLSPHRPLCGLPSALLRTSRQVYEECRTIPMQTNEFVFVNWFSSGLWAARAFTRGLKGWQRDSMRFTRLEMLGRDFTGPALREWVELCACWASGLRGLRLKILIGGGIFEPTATFAALNNNAEAQAMDISRFPEPRPEWIEEGLRKMGCLRRLEVELSVLDWDDEQKIEWCNSLEGILNEGRERERWVKVRFLNQGIVLSHFKDPSEQGLAYNPFTHSIKMCGHVMRGRFAQRCAECIDIDYSTAWSPQVRICVLILITVLSMRLNPPFNNFVKRVMWMVVKPFALLVGYLFVAFICAMLFIFIDGPKMFSNWTKSNNNQGPLNPLNTMDVDNNTKLNCVMVRLHATAAKAWVAGEGGVFDKKYKPFLAADDMNFAGPRQKKAMTRKRNLSC